jgi:hypothetical protein
MQLEGTLSSRVVPMLIVYTIRHCTESAAIGSIATALPLLLLLLLLLQCQYAALDSGVAVIMSLIAGSHCCHCCYTITISTDALQNAIPVLL